MSQLENALSAARRGFRVFPCGVKSKKAAFIKGVLEHGCVDATADETTIRKWWAINPDFNPAITGGTIIDADVGLTSLEDALQFAKDNLFPDTLLIRTGRRPEFGAQFHFSNVLTSGLYLARGVSGEVRGKNEYGMAAGSVHPSGTLYEIALDLPRAIADENLLRAFRKKPPFASAPKPGFKVSQGERFYWLRSQCGRLVNAGLSGAALVAALKALNQDYCDPPKDDGDVETLANAASEKFTANVNPPPSQRTDDSPAHDEALARIEAWLASEDIPNPRHEDAYDDLAQLTEEEYARVRRDVGKRLKLKFSMLDSFVRKRRVASKHLAATTVATGLTADQVRKALSDLLLTTQDERAALGLPESIEKASEVAENGLWQYITENAQAFCTESGQGYLLFHIQKEMPIPIRSDGKELDAFLSELGIHPGAAARNRIGKFIGNQCYRHGVRVEPKMTFHFDPVTFTGYFAEQPGKLIKITANEIIRVDNGTDGILFLVPEKFEPWTLDLENLPPPTNLNPDAFALLPELLFDVLEFENESLGREDIEVLLNAYIATLELPGIVAGKLLLQILGLTGSGKTLFLRMLGRFIYGRQFEVTGLDQKVEQLENAVVNNSFLVLDDVKMTTDPMVLGVIRRSCTGGSVTRRELYSTFGQVVEPLRAAIALTCSEDPFAGSDEMSNRALVLRAKSRDEFIDENELLQKIDANRPELLAEMMVRLQSVIVAVEAQANFKPKVKLRMASFAVFILRVGRQFDWGESAKEVLDCWLEEQQGAGLDDSIVESLALWFKDAEIDWSKHYSAGELYKELMRVRTTNGLSAPWWEEKEGAMVRNMRNSAKAYLHHFGFCFKSRSSGHHPAEYWFDPGKVTVKLEPAAKAAAATATPDAALNDPTVDDIPF